MVPLPDGKHPGEQDLKSQSGKGYNEDGAKKHCRHWIGYLNVSEIKTPKLSGNPRNVYLLGAYTLGITAIYGLQLI